MSSIFAITFISHAEYVSEFLPFILTEMNWRVYHNGGKLSKMNLVEYWKANSPKLLYSTSVRPHFESIVSRHQLMMRIVYMWPWMMVGSNYRTMIRYMMWDDTFSKPTPRSPFAKPTIPGLRNSGHFRAWNLGNRGASLMAGFD